MPKRLLAALFVSRLAAAIAFAQSTPPASSSDDELRGSGGQIELLGKNTDPLSGSLSISASRSQLPFTAGLARGYSGTLGGTIVPDRLWFFASAEQSNPIFSTAPIVTAPAARRIDTNFAAQLGERQNLGAQFAAAPSRLDPSSFLSLHYTGILSSSSFFTATVSRNRTSQPVLLLPPQ